MGTRTAVRGSEPLLVHSTRWVLRFRAAVVAVWLVELRLAAADDDRAALALPSPRPRPRRWRRGPRRRLPAVLLPGIPLARARRARAHLSPAVRAFRSLLLPLKAIALNVFSVSASYGMLVVFFRWGLGAPAVRLYRFDQIEGWIPIFLFALLFGLSMDYEVFLVRRMREAWDAGLDNSHAVADGLERAGRIVTAAAIIMVAAFSGFVDGRIAGLQEFGLGLAVAILIDATVVRAVLVPALMEVLGRWNWWLPASVARLARVEPSPLRRSPNRSC
jgi:MMPL family